MQVSFRQGIVRSVPNFLRITGNTVSIVIPQPSYVLVTVADGVGNYLFPERESVSNAWVGPFQTGMEYWLYWDLNSLTGVKTYGFTVYEPVEAAAPPLSPAPDQHWFDTTAMRMKVWNAAAGRWVNKIRVFAAKMSTASELISMSINSPSMEGTQIGSVPVSAVPAGYLVYDTDGKVLRKGDGTFFTTEDAGVTGITSSSHVKLGAVVKEAAAAANISRNSLVSFIDFDKVAPVTPDNLTQTTVVGIVEKDAVYGEFVNVTTEGVVSSPDWDWSPYGVNTLLYVGNGSALTPIPVPPAVYPVATIIGRNSIQLGSPRTTVNVTTTADVMTTATAGTARLSVLADAPADPIVVGTNDPRVVTALSKLGGTMTGMLFLHADPIGALEAATKQYVDSSLGSFQLPLSGVTAGSGYNIFTVTDRGVITSAGVAPYISAGGTSVDGSVPRFVGITGQAVESSSVAVGANGEISGYKALFNVQTGSTYLLGTTDTGKVIDHNSTAAVIATLPNTMPIGFCCTYTQSGTGQITFVPDVGATLRHRLSHTKTAGQWASATLFVRSNTTGTNAEYVLAGDTAL